MSEDERLEILSTAAVAHAGLDEIAFRLRRRLPAKAAALKAAVKAEQAAFRLKRELEQFSLADPKPEAPAQLFRGGKAVDINRLRR